jgi:miniconductance mechanosensitive channel
MQDTTAATSPALLDPAGWATALGLEGVAAWLNARPLAATTASLVLLAFTAWLLLVLIRRYVLRVVTRVAQRSSTFWDEVLLQKELFHRLSLIVPVLLVWQGIAAVPNLAPSIIEFVQRLAIATLVLIGLRSLSALLSGVSEIYSRYDVARQRPIKGYLQVVSVVAHIAGAILVIATLVGQSPLFFLSGIGAMTAIILLVFRDTLLSLVAGIQLTSNDLIRVGDWIEMPQFGADGDVIDIALNSVRVQNWDRTFSVIPTHKFLEHSFRNWRGMTESGGRRIKRSLHLDMTTVRFLTDDEAGRFARFTLLADYMAEKRRTLAEHNRAVTRGDGWITNERRLTNAGTFRAYIAAYLRSHPRVHQDMTFLIRQLQPTPEGLPLEIYVFTNDTEWANYEAIQADIFDHLLAMIPQFGLRVFQKPSGADFGRLSAPPRTRALAIDA